MVNGLCGKEGTQNHDSMIIVFAPRELWKQNYQSISIAYLIVSTLVSHLASLRPRGVVLRLSCRGGATKDTNSGVYVPRFLAFLWRPRRVFFVFQVQNGHEIEVLRDSVHLKFFK